MKVFFTASYGGKKRYQANYDLVRETIKRFKVELISPEEKNYHLVLDAATRKKFPDYESLHKDSFWHYEAIRQGIHWADAVIVDVSQEDFQLGHEVTLAIMEKKPVLCLSVREDFSQKIHHDYFFGSKYTKHTIEAVIQDFFANVRELSHSRRFNMFLYPSQIDHLELMAKQYGMNMSEYVRRLINLDRRTSSMNTE